MEYKVNESPLDNNMDRAFTDSHIHWKIVKVTSESFNQESSIISEINDSSNEDEDKDSEKEKKRRVRRNRRKGEEE